MQDRSCHPQPYPAEAGNESEPDDPRLLVGEYLRDDAAVIDPGRTALISTTDFFMPILDDPFDFGRIASANAISDIYAMGGHPDGCRDTGMASQSIGSGTRRR